MGWHATYIKRCQSGSGSDRCRGHRKPRDQPQVAPGFQQAKSDILERAEAAGKSLAKQAAFFEQLEEQVSDLEQVVEDFAGIVVLAAGVLQVETAIFLDVETLILDLPT